jgi:hypothetical protein
LAYLIPAGNTDALHFAGPPQTPILQSAIHIVRACVAERLVGIERLVDRSAVILVAGMQSAYTNSINSAVLFQTPAADCAVAAKNASPRVAGAQQGRSDQHNAEIASHHHLVSRRYWLIHRTSQLQLCTSRIVSTWLFGSFCGDVDIFIQRYDTRQMKNS